MFRRHAPSPASPLPAALAATVAAGLVCASPGTAAEAPATASAADTWVLNLNIENDLLGGSDEYYTSGLQVTGVSPDLRTDGGEVPGWVRPFVEVGPFSDRSDTLYRARVSLTNEIYTDSSVLNDYDPNQRPMAGWLHLDLGLTAANDRRRDALELSLGTTGNPSLGEFAQNVIHAVLDNPEPEGWEDQLRAEPTFQLTWMRSWHWRKNYASGWAADFIPRLAGTAGNVHINIEGGADARFGWGLPYDYGRSRIRQAGTHAVPFEPADGGQKPPGRVAVFGILGAESRLVARNLFLDGNTFDGDPGVGRERFVTELRAGLGLAFGNLSIQMTEHFRSQEYQRQPDWHIYGSFSASYRF